MVVLWCLLIIVARVVDVSLGTIRTINVVQGRRRIALFLGFFEILIWVFVVSGVIHMIKQPVYAVSYALGFALGNFVGMTIERRLAFGRQVVRIISRRGPELAADLREAGLRVTQFDGYGRDGPVQEVFVEIRRREARSVIAQARALDPPCFYTVDDIRATSSMAVEASQPGGWRAILKKK